MCMCVCYDDILGILLTKHHVLNSDDRISCQFHGVDLCQKSNFMSYIGTVRKQSDVACGFLAFVPSENSFYCQCCKLKPMFTGRYSSAQGSVTAQGVEQKWYCTNQVIVEQTVNRDLMLQTRKNWLEISKLEESLAAVIIG